MRRGEIRLVALEPTVGAEIGKTRPVVIVSDETVGILLLEVIKKMGLKPRPYRTAFFQNRGYATYSCL